ncbi:MAG: metallophosphoesterase [Planctomycetes bacterium]|nr:metallophosphoesterase [Planctomycetota bacterium]
MAVKLCHFSDIHLTAKPMGWSARDVVGKRATGWFNLTALGRGSRFRHAPSVVDVLRRDLATRGYDHLVFSGDATMLGFESEMKLAANALGVGDATLPPCIAVPGNHDVYIGRAEKKRLFEASFASWQQGQRVGDSYYPFAQKVGHVWLIALNSSRANFWPWDASGRVGEPQLARLRELTATLDPGPRIVVSHYPIMMPSRRPEPRYHRLRDWKRVKDVAVECGVSLWLHGHKHGWYVLPTDAELPFATICVGSTTQARRWGYHEYTIDGGKLAALRRVYDLAAGAFVDADRFELELKG